MRPGASRKFISISLALGALGAFALSGCGAVRHVVQAARGQLELANRARPIEQVIRDERTPPRLKSLLSEVPAAKAYGEEHGLKPTKNYTEYVKLDRPAAIWVVAASKPLKFEPKEWGFPIIGKFPFIGWFDREDADRQASELRKDGWDVYVRGAPAYSTLGWFRDAILSTMIPEGDEAVGELVNVVFHESMHATLYISGQSNFNERLAVFVAEKLTDSYLRDKKGAESIERTAYLDSEKRSAEREKIYYEAYQALDSLYASQKSDEEKLNEKAKVIAQLKARVNTKREINNATLMQFKTYHVEKDEFGDLYRACGSDMKRFITVLSRLKADSFTSSQQEDFRPVLAPLVGSGCS